MGCCYHALGQFEKAITYYDTAIDMGQENTQFLMHIAQCEYDQG
jgi:tetratricopeptide (TPR) repeat protein